MMRCLIATLGKDAPGLNAFVRAGARIATRSNMEVFGVNRGFVGVLANRYHRMKPSDVGHILGTGGSILGSSDFRIEADDDDTIARLASSLTRFDLVVATGGLGSFAILNRMYRNHELGKTTTLFVPASIENEFLNPRRKQNGECDVHAESIGADTAANTAIQAIARLREQSYLSRTVFLVECVGLKSNYLPIQIGAGCGAHRIYLPRFPMLSQEARSEIKSLYGERFDPDRMDVRELVGWIERMFANGKRAYLVVIVPSGLPLLTFSTTHERRSPAESYESIVSPMAPMAPIELTLLGLVDQLDTSWTGSSNVQIRYVILDDLQLGGAPSLRDRMLGSLYGNAAIEEFLSIVKADHEGRLGNLNLLAIADTNSVGWNCYPREEVTPLFMGARPRAGGLDPLPFFRQMRGTVSGYRPWTETPSSSSEDLKHSPAIPLSPRWRALRETRPA